VVAMQDDVINLANGGTGMFTISDVPETRAGTEPAPEVDPNDFTSDPVEQLPELPPPEPELITTEDGTIIDLTQVPDQAELLGGSGSFQEIDESKAIIEEITTYQVNYSTDEIRVDGTLITSRFLAYQLSAAGWYDVEYKKTDAGDIVAGQVPWKDMQDLLKEADEGGWLIFKLPDEA